MNDGKILVFGANGQVGRSIRKALPNVICATRDDADFEIVSSLLNLLNQHHPSIVINTAAYTSVDNAEEEITLSNQINGEAVRHIARWCAANNALLIHFSTDYVYEGNGNLPQTETSPLSPKNQYGMSKLLGEKYIEETTSNYIILRTSWVYDEIGHNFVKTMLRLGKEKEELRIVADQFGSPTYAADIATAVKSIISQVSLPIRETYNLCGSGFTNWHEFAEQIFRLGRSIGIPLTVRTVIPVSSQEYKARAIRPSNSRMSMEKIKSHFGIVPPKWQESLRVCILNMDKK